METTGNAPTSRRSFLKIASLSLAGGAFIRCKPGGPASESPVSPFRFIVVNDLHHATEECTPFLDALVAHMRGQGPVDFCLIVGDLADTGLRESLVAVRDAFAKLGAPIHAVPGNHDCDLEENSRLFSEIFPGQLNQAFAHGGWQFIGLDSTDGKAWNDTRIGSEALGFLEGAAAAFDRAAPTVLFTHFPLAPDVRMASLNSGEVFARLEGFNLRCTFSGHYHARTERNHGDTPVLTNTCCSRVRAPHDDTLAEGYLICTAHPDGRLVRDFIEYQPAERPA